MIAKVYIVNLGYLALLTLAALILFLVYIIATKIIDIKSLFVDIKEMIALNRAKTTKNREM